jgi:predicted  nucleic acid-binding Zn-ribbon protein
MPEKDTILPILMALVSAISGLTLSWLNFRRESRSSIIEDLDKVRKALSEENARLSKRIERLQRQLLEETAKRVALEERLELERDIFSHRLTALEDRLRHSTEKGGEPQHGI